MAYRQCASSLRALARVAKSFISVEIAVMVLASALRTTGVINPPGIATAIPLFVSIIGIPMGIANLKLIPVSLMPLGKQIVSTRSPFAAPAGHLPRV